MKNFEFLSKKKIFILLTVLVVLGLGIFLFSQKSDTVCGDIGAEGYSPESIENQIPEILLTRGKLITVDNNSDIKNGNVSSFKSLLANPGPDGISLREAIETIENDPGQYTIKFADHLRGTTINIGSWDKSPLPILKSGNVIINGDITENGKPDITINNGGIENHKPIAFQISSGNNTLHGLKIENFTIGVNLISLGQKETTFANNNISSLVLKNIDKNGILLHPLIQRPLPEETVKTDNKWVDTIIVNNEIEAGLGGINFFLHFISGENLQGTKIINNKVVLKGVRFSEGISLTAGLWGGADENKITDTLIADNNIKISGADDSIGIRVAAGDNGGSKNFIDDVIILNNDIEMVLGDDNKPAGMGIFVSAGDSSTIHDDPDYRPIIYPDENIHQNVQILNNNINGYAYYGIYIMSGILGAEYNFVKDVSVMGNTINIVPSYVKYAGRPGGIGIYSGPPAGIKEDFGESRFSTKNMVSEIIVRSNTIKLSESYTAFDYDVPGLPYPGDPKAIIIHQAIDNQIEEIYLSHNKLSNGNILNNTQEIEALKVFTQCNQIDD